MLRAAVASAFIVSGLIALSACSSGHAVPAGSATVTTCDDGTAYNLADRTSGQTLPPAPATDNYDVAAFGMRLVAGRWAVSSVTVIVAPPRPVHAATRR